MFAITGITGKVGGAVARHLIGQGHKIRAVVRSEEKGRRWASLGCEVATATVEDPVALARAFDNTDGVFLMTPPNFDPEPGFPQTKHAAARSGTPSSRRGPGRSSSSPPSERT